MIYSLILLSKALTKKKQATSQICTSRKMLYCWAMSQNIIWRNIFCSCKAKCFWTFKQHCLTNSICNFIKKVYFKACTVLLSRGLTLRIAYRACRLRSSLLDWDRISLDRDCGPPDRHRGPLDRARGSRGSRGLSRTSRSESSIEGSAIASRIVCDVQNLASRC